MNKVKIPVSAHVAESTGEMEFPTCTTAGKQMMACKVCGQELTAEEIPATGHDEGRWYITIKNSTQKQGERELRYTVCQEVLKKEVLPKIEKDIYSMTACSLGLRFRDVSRKTDKWYMFTPIDVSQNATMYLDLIAGNVHMHINII